MLSCSLMSISCEVMHALACTLTGLGCDGNVRQTQDEREGAHMGSLSL